MHKQNQESRSIFALKNRKVSLSWRSCYTEELRFLSYGARRKTYIVLGNHAISPSKREQLAKLNPRKIWLNRFHVHIPIPLWLAVFCYVSGVGFELCYLCNTLVCWREKNHIWTNATSRVHCYSLLTSDIWAYLYYRKYAL